MWWIIIIVIVVFIIGKFAFDKSNQASKVAMEGGMRTKYEELIGYIREGDSRTQIYQETSDSITLGISNMGGSTIFVLTQTFGSVTVQWKINSPIFGKHKLEWKFDEYMDQYQMMEKIVNDTGKFNENLMQSHGMQDH